MKGILLSILFLGALAAPTTQAERLTDETCRAYGDLVYQMAARRDEGYSVYDLRAMVLTKFDKSIREPSLVLLDQVFKRPWLSPSEEAATFVRDCKELVRGKPTSYTY